MDFETLAKECEDFLKANNAQDVFVYDSKNHKTTKKIVVASKEDEVETKKLAKLFQNQTQPIRL